MKGGFTVKDKMFRRLISLVLVLVMTVPTLACVFADDSAAEPEAPEEVRETSAQSLDDENRARTYSTYYDKHAGDPRPNEEAVINAVDYLSASDDAEARIDTLEGVDALVWEGASGEVSFDVDIPKDGVYAVKMSYYALSGSANSIEFALLIDGEAPFASAEQISLPKIWVSSEKSFEYDDAGVRSFRRDVHGNQIRPTLEESLGWQEAFLKDSDGLFNGALGFYVTAGKHTITLRSDKARFAISTITFTQEDAIQPAAKLDNVTTDESKAASSKDIFVSIEGEDPTSASDITLYPTYDRATYLTSPSDPTKMIYNTIGKENWKTSGQYISWDFTMPAAGWVKIGIRAKQDQMRGLYSNRTLYIDGKVPCEEAEQIKFYYSTTWDCVVPSDAEGKTLYFYLDAGEHNIMLEAMPGEIGGIMRQLDDVVYYLNSYYRQILQITGPSPDEYNTYMIQNQIEGILEDFQSYADTLRDIKGEIETLAGTSGTEAVSLETMAKLLDRLVDKPDEIPGSLGQIKDNISSLSQWMADYRSQALEIDVIEIASADKEFSPIKENFFKQLSFSFRSFLGSFFEDYNVLSEDNKAALNVWVSLGRDQAQIVKELVDSYFVEDTGIPININLVQGGILESTLAGKGPDVVLFVGGDLPIQLAARDCLVDISQFPDYQEVIKRFAPNVMTLYTYQNGVYGLPISQNFSMMFCRNDVLAGFGFDKGPDTWTELIDMLPTLQRSYMGVGFNFDVYGTFMVQRGLGYYNENKTKTIFDQQEAVEAFEMWCKFYSTYSFEQTFDQFTRFRSGEYPIVITGYTFYNQLYMAAPEIRGLWQFDAIPGTEEADGTVNHSTTSSSAGGIIFSKLNEKQRADAWELIKWFTSAEIQSEYGRSIEALLGPLGRFETANREALGQLAWNQTELEKIRTQMDNTVDIDIIPATYIVTRNITNAFRETVNQATNPRDTLVWYNRDINDEIIRKYEELGIEVPQD